MDSNPGLRTELRNFRAPYVRLRYYPRTLEY